MRTEVADDSLSGLRKLIQDMLCDMDDVKRLTADLLNAHTGVVLVVDDNPEVLKIFTDLLSSDDRLWQLRTVGASTFAEAARIIRDHRRLALGILDYNLDNGRTCEELCKSMRAKGIPVIVISGTPETAENFCREYRIPLLAKPVNYHEVYGRACYMALKNKLVSRSKNK